MYCMEPSCLRLSECLLCGNGQISRAGMCSQEGRPGLGGVMTKPPVILLTGVLKVGSLPMDQTATV